MIPKRQETGRGAIEVQGQGRQGSLRFNPQRFKLVGIFRKAGKRGSLGMRILPVQIFFEASKKRDSHPHFLILLFLESTGAIRGCLIVSKEYLDVGSKCFFCIIFGWRPVGIGQNWTSGRSNIFFEGGIILLRGWGFFFGGRRYQEWGRICNGTRSGLSGIPPRILCMVTNPLKYCAIISFRLNFPQKYALIVPIYLILSISSLKKSFP